MPVDLNTLDSQSMIALFGGSFDPVHNGHLHIASSILDSGLADHILFMPAASPPHKQHANITSGEHRLNMLELAVTTDTMSVSDFELERSGPSYSIDTTEHFRSLGLTFTFVIGMDSLVDLHKWYRVQEFVESNTFIVVNRHAVPHPDAAVLSDYFGEVCAQRLIASIVDIHPPGLSSTSIRAEIAAGKSLDSELPKPVFDYIVRHELYKNPNERS